MGIAPELSDAELVSLAVLQALLGFDSEARFVRYAKAHPTPWFPYVPQRPGYNKRLRRSGELIKHVMACLARAWPSWHDDVWLVDSTPVECGRSRETPKRSDTRRMGLLRLQRLAIPLFLGPAPAPHNNPVGPPITFALAGAKADERDVCLDMIAPAGVAAASCNDPSPSPPRSGTTKPPNNQAPPAPCSPTTTDPLELII